MIFTTEAHLGFPQRTANLEIRELICVFLTLAMCVLLLRKGKGFEVFHTSTTNFCMVLLLGRQMTEKRFPSLWPDGLFSPCLLNMYSFGNSQSVSANLTFAQQYTCIPYLLYT